MKTRKDIFKRYQKEYQLARDSKGNRRVISEIFTAVTQVTGMNRKSVNRAFLNQQYKYLPRQENRGRKATFTPDALAALYDLWHLCGNLCGERLHPMIAEYTTILKRDHMWQHSNYATEKVLAMSLGTIKRLLRHFSNKVQKEKGYSATKPSQLKHLIPIFHGKWSNKPPGHGQIDTVAHCGHTLLGDFAYSLQYVDVAMYWSIIRAQWNKGQQATLDNLCYINDNLPWKLREMHPDTGSEFINWLVKEWCDTVAITMTRSRPGHSNDNAHVEERNGNIIRKYIGYVRLDCKEAVDALNSVYEVLCQYLNHFAPSRRVVEKIEIKGKWKKKYEKVAKTPYQRVLESKDIPKAIKNGLKAEHENLNPVVLLAEVARRKKVLYDIQRKYGKQTEAEPTSRG